MKSANQLYSDKAVDKISIHTYLAKERIKDFNLVNGEWSCKSMPSIFIDESRSKQMKNKEILNTNIQRGKELIESVTNPEVKKGMKEALSQLQSSLEKVQRQEKGLKKGFFCFLQKEKPCFSTPLFLFICVLTHYLFAVKFVL